jgi:hypothetical protein
MRTIFFGMMVFLAMAYLLIPDWVFAAGAGGTELIVVADTRRVSWGAEKYLLDVYNTNLTLFGVLCLLLTLFWGMFLGFFTDFLMKRTGLDLESRTLVEH